MTLRLNPVWHRMLYSCTHMATVGVKGTTARKTHYRSFQRRPSQPVSLLVQHTYAAYWVYKTKQRMTKWLGSFPQPKISTCRMGTSLHGVKKTPEASSVGISLKELGVRCRNVSNVAHRDWNLKQIFTQNRESADVNWGEGAEPPWPFQHCPRGWRPTLLAIMYMTAKSTTSRLCHSPSSPPGLQPHVPSLSLRTRLIDWLSMVLRLRQHNIGYTENSVHWAWLVLT